MDWFVRTFLRAGLVSLGLGVTLGLAMAWHPAWIVYRPAHVHLNLLGFVTMTIYGVAYHVIPRFAGVPLFSRSLAAVHVWGATTGLAAMVAGFMLLPHAARAGRVMLVLGGLAGAAAAYLFVYNIWRTLGAAPKPISLVQPARRAG
jgi:heme/copper-type cytochrome/quinol oxidase subunit 1